MAARLRLGLGWLGPSPTAAGCGVGGDGGVWRVGWLGMGVVGYAQGDRVQVWSGVGVQGGGAPPLIDATRAGDKKATRDLSLRCI